MGEPIQGRPGTAADAIDGVVPAWVTEPATAGELAQALAHATRDRLPTVLRGSGTKLGWGRVPPSVDLVVSTARLDGLVAHRHGDLTATVQAGMRLEALNDALSRHGQCLPVESAFPATTVGGLLATNESGPLRHRFGTPRDLLIGVTLAMPDGRVVKAGGTVVKNVAGYDLGKLVTGSFGTLAAVVEASFKLLPLPRASTTLVAAYAESQALVRDVRAVADSQLELTAFDLAVSDADGLRVLARLASSPAATDAQAAAAGRLLRGAAVVTGEAERELWEGQVRAPWAEGGTVVRLSWLPSALPDVLAQVEALRGAPCGPVTMAGRLSGAGLLHLAGDPADAARAVLDLRAHGALGHVVVLRAPRQVKDAVDVWGPDLSSAGAARALKRMFDPAGILNAGRGPV
jgi:glycolate oxidase FAD binding subunit